MWPFSTKRNSIHTSTHRFERSLHGIFVGRDTTYRSELLAMLEDRRS
jgi:hypothetical protein